VRPADKACGRKVNALDKLHAPLRGMSNLNMVTAEETDFMESDYQKRALPKVTPVLALLDVVAAAALLLATLVACILASAGV